MNAACQAQLERMRVELNGRLTLVWNNDREFVVCFCPSAAMPDAPAEEIQRRLPPLGADLVWERMTSPVLILYDGVRTRTLCDPEAVAVAAAIARGEHITCELLRH